MHLAKHKKRDSIPSGEVTAASGQPTASSLILVSGAVESHSQTDAPPIASGFTPTVTTTSSTPSVTSNPTSSAPATSSNASAIKGSSSVAVSTVVAACVGSFVGLALLICLFIWWSRHPSTKTRNLPRSPVSENRNARGRAEQERVRSQMWNKLDGDRPQPSRQMSQQEIDEKNFSMFKKRSPSVHTTRTTKALEEHGFDMPPLSKYHPDLAKEFALEQPDRPYAQRQESGVSWDGETLGDDSFLSLRSVRIESGTMSPTLGMAKMTPPAMPSQLHRWESAEVLTVDETPAENFESANPFADATEDRRKSRSNPFFNAGEVHRSASRRSRSNSRGQSHSRNASRTSRSTVRARVVSEAGSQIDPFADVHGVSLPEAPRHKHASSIASGESGDSTSDRTMQSLIAALDLTRPHESLRVSIPPSTASRYSSFLEPEDDVGIARDHPPTPTTPKGY